MRKVYLDNAAATPIAGGVISEMSRAARIYSNPSSFNDSGRKARTLIDKSRLSIAGFLTARPEEIIFTGSGSEANNLAIKGVLISGGGEIITTPIEHLSVLEPVKELGKIGRTKVNFLKVDPEGFINLNDLESKINKKTILVSIIYANNEIGTIQPIKKISKIIKNFRSVNGTNSPLFHIDACQAAEYLDMNVQNLGVDLLTFNGSKIYGPRGVAVLYVRKAVNILPLVSGGSQERGLRAGTENTPAIAGLAKAVSLIKKNGADKISKLRDYFIEQLKSNFDVKINGPLGTERLPTNVNISFSGLNSEDILLELDKYGIYAGSGSACTSHSVEPSHVLKAIGVPKKYLTGAIRFSLGRQNTKEEIDYTLKSLGRIIPKVSAR